MLRDAGRERQKLSEWCIGPPITGRCIVMPHENGCSASLGPDKMS